MPSAAEMKAKFWNALESDRTIMLGLQGNEDVHPRPMTAMVEDESGPIWFFTAKDTEIPGLWARRPDARSRRSPPRSTIFLPRCTARFASITTRR